jgi:hypothetical protein
VGEEWGGVEGCGVTVEVLTRCGVGGEEGGWDGKEGCVEEEG